MGTGVKGLHNCIAGVSKTGRSSTHLALFHGVFGEDETPNDVDCNGKRGLRFWRF